MGKGSKKQEYPTTTVNTSLFGKATTKKSGTKYKPTKFQKELVGVTESNATNALKNYLNPDYESEDYKRGEEYFQNKMGAMLQDNYLNPALSRNLLRGSTASDAMRGFANDLTTSEYERQQDYRDQQLQNYLAAMMPYTTIYDMQQGTSGLSQALSNAIGNYNLQNNKSSNSGGLGSLLGGIGSVGGGIAASQMSK